MLLVTFSRFCKAAAKIDGPFQYLIELLNDPLCRDFLADFNQPPRPTRPIRRYTDLVDHLDFHYACDAARLGAAKTFRAYRQMQRRGLA